MSSRLSAVLLAGGRGTRLAAVLPDLPKVLAPIGGVSLLSLQLSKLTHEGCAQAVVVGGYGAERVREALTMISLPYPVAFLGRTSGTLDAVLAGISVMEPSTRPTLVLNADTVIDVDYRLCQRLSLSWAPVTAVLTSLATGQNDEGVLLSSRGEILAFEEGPYSSEVDLGLGPEGGAGAPFLATSHRYLTNAGLYFVNNSRLLQDEAVLRRTGMSWERNALVHYRRSGLLAGITPPVRYVLDVGTPERYERAGRCGPATAG